MTVITAPTMRKFLAFSGSLSLFKNQATPPPRIANSTGAIYHRLLTFCFVGGGA
jgi:hypothetical protein